jgi:hypothetical protein
LPPQTKTSGSATSVWYIEIRERKVGEREFEDKVKIYPIWFEER